MDDSIVLNDAEVSSGCSIKYRLLYREEKPGNQDFHLFNRVVHISSFRMPFFQVML